MKGEIKIGVLLPQSKQFKTLDRDFINGIRLNNLNAKLHIESIGIASDSKFIIEKIQKLSLQEEIKIFIGFLGHHNVEQIYEYAAENGIILIASDMGANMPYGKTKYDGVYINSFGMIESAHFLGKYFSENNYKKIGTSSSFYDSGYGFLEAIQTSFNDEISFAGHYITPLQPRENEAEIMNTTIVEYNAEVVFGFFSGLYAQENISFLSENSVNKRYPFYLMPFSVESGIEKKISDNLNNLYVITPWIKNLTEECKKFNSEYMEVYEEEPTIFSLLGYECGLVINSVISDKSNKISLIKKNIEELELNGPRGIIRFDNEINRSFFDHHIYRMTLNPDGKVIPIVMNTFKNNGDFIKSTVKSQNRAYSMGWQNAYLCH